jgi:hypothetical protein
MRTLTEKYLGGLPLEKVQYEADFAVVEKYQSFSAELLRLSLLGIAGYGFLITNIVLKVTNKSDEYLLLKSFLMSRTTWVLILGAIALGISSAAALGHRYFATDCITHFVRRLRAEKKCCELAETSPLLESLAQVVKNEQRSLEKDVEMCRWLLVAASLFLVIGAASVAGAFAFTLSGAK